ncbi:uncharacterized protein LOC130666753 [Microplitis mediator]|uniref:uncharacterized protein LOC130666753 n=1 Tax=Microplitis mediator TaxID=375433 RepID=UPI00255280D6|nr:uncharacterized protein LOC130666753 [Microplitis mediator]
MLLYNIYKNVCNNPRVRYYGVMTANKLIKKLDNNKLPNHSCLREQKLINSIIKTSNHGDKKFYSVQPEEEANLVRLPALTDDPLILVPNFFKTFKSSYNLHMQIRGSLDNEFDMIEFSDGSKQAVEVVSHALAEEDYDSLQGLVIPDVIEKLRKRISLLSEEQKKLIPIKKGEIYANFPYSIDVRREGDEDRERVFADITMAYYSLRGFEEMQKRGELPPLEMGIMPEYREKIYLSNYRFTREYTENVTSSWIVTMCNELMLVTAI